MRALTALVILTVTVTAAEPVSWRSDYTAARKEASEAQKGVCLVISSENCIYCRKLEAGPLQDPVIMATLREHFVAIKVDAAREAELVRMLKVNLYPTTLLAGPDGTIHAVIKGYVAPDVFREHLRVTRETIAAAQQSSPEPNPTRPALRPQVLMEVARQLHDHQRHAEALDLYSEIVRRYPQSNEAKAASVQIDAMRKNPETLRLASRQADEKAAALHMEIAERSLKQGDRATAQASLELVLQLSPNGQQAETAKLHLTKLKDPLIVTPASLKKD